MRSARWIAAGALVLVAVPPAAPVIAFPLNDHLKCYKVKAPLKLSGIVDLNSPQFGLEQGCKISKPKLFCVPVQKRVVQVTPSTPQPIVGDEIVDDRLCYQIKCPKPPVPLPNRDVVDQFALHTLSTFKPFLVCAPARKTPIEVDVFPDTSATVTIEPNPLCPTGETVMLSGPTTVNVALGMLGDPDRNGLEQVPTEMVQLDLSGTSACFGQVMVRLRDPAKHPHRRTTGEIEETVNTQTGRLDVPPFAPTGTANSFFDVFFEVEVANFPGVILHNDTPKRMRSVITHKPPDPGNTYDNPDVIQLYDENEQPSPIRIGSSRHVPNPTTTTTTTTLPRPQTLCCNVPPGALGNPIPVCLDAVVPDVDAKCSLLGGQLVPGAVCDPITEVCSAARHPNDFCCQCPVPSPPFPHPQVCFEGMFAHNFKCQPPCILMPGVSCGPVSERCGGSPSGAFLDVSDGRL